MCTQNILQGGPHAGHKASLSKFKKSEIISSIFSDHNAMKSEIYYKLKNCKKKKKTHKQMEAKQYAT